MIRARCDQDKTILAVPGRPLIILGRLYREDTVRDTRAKRGTVTTLNSLSDLVRIRIKAQWAESDVKSACKAVQIHVF